MEYRLVMEYRIGLYCSFQLLNYSPISGILINHMMGICMICAHDLPILMWNLE